MNNEHGQAEMVSRVHKDGAYMESEPVARTGSRDGMRPWKSGHRLKTVLVTTFFLLLATSMALFAYRVLNQEVQQNIQILKQQANVLASNVAATSSEALLGRDYTAIEQMLLRAIQFPGIDEIQVADMNGKVLSDVVLENGRGQPRYGSSVIGLPVAAQVHINMNKGQMVVWQPVFLGDLLGWVRVTQSLASITAIENRIWTTNALFAIVLLVSTVVLVMLILHKPMLWLRRYAEFADRLGEKRGEQIGICTTASELESLGEALNRASRRLYEQDITIQKGMDDLERLAAFPEKNPDIVLSLNTRGELQYLNPYGRGVLENLGLSENEINRLLPDNYHVILEMCGTHGNTAREIEANYAGRTFLWSFSPIKNRDLLHCYGSEITDRKRVEERAKKALLEKSVAEAASQAKSMFLANMSHEIRTPLTAIIGFSEALLNVNQGTSERVEAVQTIRRAGKHLLTVINDILDLSKIEAGRLEIERLTVNLFELVEDVTSLARLQLESKDVQFSVQPQFPLPRTVYSDPVRIRQVLLNLISNAIKFTDHGKITLRLRYDADSQSLALEIEDTGIGIKPEQLSRMFTPFTQADASTTRRFGGTGLGLTLSKQMAEMLGGTITVDSEPNQGSRFTFTIDVGEVETLFYHPDEVPNTLPVSTLKEEVERLSGTVLVAEDNPDNQRLIQLNARYLGIAADVVENGELAVAAALTQPYDLILMDMQMPIMDGLTATRLLRARGYLGPIVALTANATPQYKQSCFTAGCNGFLTKPIERLKFNEMLGKYLKVSESLNMGNELGAANKEPRIFSELLQEGSEMADLIEYFINRLPGYLECLRDAQSKSDIVMLKKQAHDLKGIGSAYGYPQVTDLAIKLEAALADEPEQVNTLIEAFALLFRRIQADANQVTADDTKQAR